MTHIFPQHRERFRFLIVGGWNTAIGYGIFITLYLWLGDHWHYLVIAAVSHLFAVTNAWLGYRWLVFRSRTSWWREYLRFNIASILLLAFQMGGLGFFSGGLGFHPLIAQVIAVTLSVLASYLFHKHFSFRRGVDQ